MSRSNKFLFSVAVLAVTACGVRPGQAHAARLAGDYGIFCVIDVTVESRDQAGLVVGTEVYSKEFFLREGESFSDDFSTRTRFKFLDATFEKNDGERTVSVNWFADVTVFNSVEFSTAVTLERGDKSGKAVGDHILFTSNGSTRTTFTLRCVED
jgi:hypothetical protein